MSPGDISCYQPCDRGNMIPSRKFGFGEMIVGVAGIRMPRAYIDCECTRHGTGTGILSSQSPNCTSVCSLVLDSVLELDVA